MRFINTFVKPSSTLLQKHCKQLLASAFMVTALAGCGGSSSDSDSTGYLKFYNASSNAPFVYLNVNETSYSGADYGQSAGMFVLDSNSYEMTLSYKEGADDYQVFNEQSVKVTDDDVNLVMLSGDFNTPEVLNYQFEDEDPTTEDGVFSFRIIDMHQQSGDVDVYVAKNDETFNEAVMLGSYNYKDMSDSHELELDSYKFYLTSAGSSEILYQSEDIPFSYTTQYIMVIRANTGPSSSSYTLDKLAKTSMVVSYPDKNSRAALKIYNALTPNALLPQFRDEIDLSIAGSNDNETIIALAKGQFSPVLDVSFGDYAIDISAVGDTVPFAENHFLSLDANSDKTLFIYHTEEEEEDDGDDNTEEEVTLYVNTLAVDNSHRISLYDHQINVVNLVSDYSQLDIYFVRSNETVQSAENHLRSTRATPRTLTLENNSYNISIVVNENESELLLAYDQLTLTADSGDLFMIIEQDDSNASGYSIKFERQNIE